MPHPGQKSNFKGEGGGLMTFLAQIFFWCYLIAISFGNNILFTELKILPVAQMAAADVTVVRAKSRHFQYKLYWKSRTRNTLFCHF